MISSALQRFCADRVDIVYLPPGTPWNNGHIESFNRRLHSESSTATTGRACSGPGFSSATSRTNTIGGIAIRRWAT
ncbi:MULTISPECIES: integrase core domain-containing protein [Nocardia]|uniref:integrase core domain-containing protein n=1 Tax=Nocardia TaxID=1817 RepID=UPI0034E1DB5E